LKDFFSFHLGHHQSTGRRPRYRGALPPAHQSILADLLENHADILRFLPLWIASHKATTQAHPAKAWSLSVLMA
jgi:hypothetical protein